MLLFSVENWSIYTGKSKQENSSLIDQAFPTDYWFHMDDAQSAHVFLRMPIGDDGVRDLNEVPQIVLQACGQLVKESSGSKKNKIVYTKVSNLKRTQDKKMEVGYKEPSLVHQVTVKERNQEILNKLKSGKTEKKVDLEMEWIDFESQLREINSAEYRQNRKQELEQNRNYKALAEQKARGYTDLFDEESMQSASNQNRSEDWEDDFM